MSESTQGRRSAQVAQLPRSRRLQDWALLALVAAACLAPFANKAFHIDDHRYVRMAQQVRMAPLDFYGFSVNLGNAEQPIAPLANNPPLIAFYAAAAANVFGWSEVGLHAAFSLLAIGALFGVWSVARRLCEDPRLAALLCLSFPVFLVSATTVMAVIGMTALFCGSLACWMKGLDERRMGWLLAGACLAALSALTKYFGLALVPLLAAYALLHDRKLGSWVVPLLVPVSVLAGYEWYTASMYGVSPIASAVGYSVTTRPDATPALARLVVAVVFAGGVLAPALLFALMGFSRRSLIATLALAACFFAAWSGFSGMPVRGADGLDWNLALHLALFSMSGAALPVLVASDLWRRRDADAALLALWAVGGFVFAAIVNYTTNGRSILPMAPPIAILLVRQIEARVAPVPNLWRYVALAPGFALALAVASGDAAMANAARSAAEQIGGRYAGAGGTLWSETSWGFQYYMTQAGARRIDVRRDVLRPGDHLARPLNWKSLLLPAAGTTKRVESFAIPASFVTTMSRDAGTGFYAIQWGPLPFRIQSGYEERFEVQSVERWLLFEDDPQRLAIRRQELDEALDLLAVVASLDPHSMEPSSCNESFAQLQSAMAGSCRGCSSADGCIDCAESVVRRSSEDRSCEEAFRDTAQAQVARCGDELGQGGSAVGAICREALRQRNLMQAP